MDGLRKTAKVEEVEQWVIGWFAVMEIVNILKLFHEGEDGYFGKRSQGDGGV